MSTFIAHVLLGESLKKIKLSLKDKKLYVNDEQFFPTDKELLSHLYSSLLMDAIKRELFYSEDYLPESYKFEYEYLFDYLSSTGKDGDKEKLSISDLKDSKFINNYIMHWFEDQWEELIYDF